MSRRHFGFSDSRWRSSRQGLSIGALISEVTTWLADGIYIPNRRYFNTKCRFRHLQLLDSSDSLVCTASALEWYHSTEPDIVGRNAVPLNVLQQPVDWQRTRQFRMDQSSGTSAERQKSTAPSTSCRRATEPRPANRLLKNH